MLPLLLTLKKRQQLSNFGRGVIVAAEDIAGVRQTDLGSEQQPMRLGQAVDRFVREVISLQRDDVDAARTRGMPVDQHVGRNVV